MLKDWNNQVRAGHAALALKAYSASKGERGCDEDDITDLIIDLLHLKTLVSQESIDGLVEWCYSCAINDEESDEDQAGIVYEEMPEGAEEELRMWERINGELTRELLATPPGKEPEICECGRPWNDCATRDGAEQHRDRM